MHGSLCTHARAAWLHTCLPMSQLDDCRPAVVDTPECADRRDEAGDCAHDDVRDETSGTSQNGSQTQRGVSDCRTCRVCVCKNIMLHICALVSVCLCRTGCFISVWHQWRKTRPRVMVARASAAVVSVYAKIRRLTYSPNSWVTVALVSMMTSMLRQDLNQLHARWCRQSGAGASGAVPRIMVPRKLVWPRKPLACRPNGWRPHR